MGNNLVPSSMLQEEEIDLISEETGFSAAQIERLYMRFKSLDKSGICGSLSREDFLRVPELAINPLCDRIVHMFFVDCDDDHERINFRQFMKVLATFRSSAKPTKTRTVSRKESIQNIFSSLSQNRFRHSRHSSCDGFFNYYPVQHHTTNQHSIHYVASTTHLSSNSNLNGFNNNNNNFCSSNYNSPSSFGVGGNGNGGGCGAFGGASQFKKPYPLTQGIIGHDEPLNSRKQKMYFMFKIYDVDDDDLITLDDLKRILKTMVGNYINEAKLNALAEKALRRADKNCSGAIEFDEFCTSFLHRDIDDLLKVKFTQARDTNSASNGTSGTSSINNKSLNFRKTLPVISSLVSK